LNKHVSDPPSHLLQTTFKFINVTASYLDLGFFFCNYRTKKILSVLVMKRSIKKRTLMKKKFISIFEGTYSLKNWVRIEILISNAQPDPATHKIRFKCGSRSEAQVGSYNSMQKQTFLKYVTPGTVRYQNESVPCVELLLWIFLIKGSGYKMINNAPKS